MQTVDMCGSWSRGTVLRWILLLLIQSASQEQEEALQRQALRAVLRVIDSVQNEAALLLETVEECCTLEHLGIGSVKEVAPFNGTGEIGWCFWRQEKESDDVISLCRCLLPWKRGLSHPLLLRVLRESVVLQRVLEVRWSLEWSPSSRGRFDDGVQSGNSESTTAHSASNQTTTSQPKTNPPTIAQSDAFLLEFDSLMRLLRHKPSLFPSLSPSDVLEHSLADMNRQLEEAKKEAKDEDGYNASSCSHADLITFIVIARQLGVVYKTIETIQVCRLVTFISRTTANRRRRSLASSSLPFRITSYKTRLPPTTANEELL